MSKIKEVTAKVKHYYEKYEEAIVIGATVALSLTAVLLAKENAKLRENNQVSKYSVGLMNNQVCDAGKAQDIIVEKLLSESEGSDECVEAMCKQAYLHGANEALCTVYKKIL